jgi:group I intron endonuclease
MIVYLVTNRINGKKYVGITANTVRRRWWRHCYDAKRGSLRLLHRAIRKYGAEVFEVQELMSGLSRHDAGREEGRLIGDLGSHGTVAGYNSTMGGEGCVGYRHTPASLAKMSAVHLGRAHTPEAKAKISASLKGRVVSQETRQKLAIASGSISVASRAKRAAALTGRRHTEEALTNMRAGHSFVSQETRDKIGASHLGRRATAETKAKMSAAMRRHYDGLRCQGSLSL